MNTSTIFVLNCGSSSIKFQVLHPEKETLFLTGIAEGVQTNQCILHWGFEKKKKRKKLPNSNYHEVIEEIVKLLKTFPDIEKKLIGIGHRVVHGGEAFSKSVIVTDDVLNKIYDCNHLAPLHNPVNALGIVVMQELYPHLPQVAVFDTAFHQSLPEYAFLYAIPYQYYKNHQIRRYGFHGTSHRYVVQMAGKTLGKNVDEISLISAHLGNGCSVCATLGGKSVDTSMGLTPLEGLVMGERCGDIDPGVVTFLAETLQTDVQAITTILNKTSGLLGLSGISHDMRLIKQAADEGDQMATISIEIFCYRLAKYIASYFVPVGLPDALIFTGGIGENAPYIRERVIKWLEPMGFTINPKWNRENGTKSSGWISLKNEIPAILVLPTNEELLIARDTATLVER